jgi:eukaryotic translation initiation factor 2C
LATEDLVLLRFSNSVFWLAGCCEVIALTDCVGWVNFQVKIMLKKVRVETTHLRVSRTHTISGLSPLACKDLKFLRQSWQHPEEPKQVSVVNYYWEVYKHRLKYPNAPALDVGRKEKPIYIPLEVWFSLLFLSFSYQVCCCWPPAPRQKKKRMWCKFSFEKIKFLYCCCWLVQLCKIVEGQWYTKPLSHTQHQKQIDFGRQSPQDRRGVCESVSLISLSDC